MWRKIYININFEVIRLVYFRNELEEWNELLDIILDEFALLNSKTTSLLINVSYEKDGNPWFINKLPCELDNSTPTTLECGSDNLNLRSCSNLVFWHGHFGSIWRHFILSKHFNQAFYMEICCWNQQNSRIRRVVAPGFDVLEPNWCEFVENLRFHETFL